MIFGTTIFQCDECSHTFEGFNAEWRATVFTAPVKCPNCSSWHTAPRGMSATMATLYRSIWEKMDEDYNEG